MKLSSSTGDFSYFAETVPQKISCFQDTKFQYLNLEQTGNIPELVSDCDEDWKRSARLATPPVALRDTFERYLYELGKCVLETYGCFEE